MQGHTADTGSASTQPVYLLHGHCHHPQSPGFASTLAHAHAHHLRPRCLCQPGGVEMYVAGLGNGHVVKRMPNTGSLHAPGCASHEPPAEPLAPGQPAPPGMAQQHGAAIIDNPATGTTTLRLDFALTRYPGRSCAPPSANGQASTSARSQAPRLGLRALLHYLWHEAELTHWHPGFAGKRNWATVRRHLLHAAEHKLVAGQPLLPRLYIPEVFAVDQRDAINARRRAHWAQALPQTGQPQRLMLLIAEVKEIAPARFCYKAVVKHLPDLAFALDAPLYRRLGRVFEAELAMWAACETLHMVMAATFGLGAGGVPVVGELCLMAVNAQWLPVADQSTACTQRSLGGS